MEKLSAEDVKGLLQNRIKMSLEALRKLLEQKVSPENKPLIDKQITTIITDLSNLAARLPSTPTAPMPVAKADDKEANNVPSFWRHNLDYGTR